MNNGKTFNLFLMDGEVTGRIKCPLENRKWYLTENVRRKGSLNTLCINKIDVVNSTSV